MLELAILGLLKEQDLHGYELKKRLTEAMGACSTLSFGSLYPALARLDAAGAVKAVDAALPGHRPPMPLTGSLGAELAALRNRRAIPKEPKDKASGRSRKVYGITDIGQRLFDELLTTAAESGSDDERSFNLRLAFARHLRPDVRLGLLERRRAYLVDRLSKARASVRAGRERLDAYTRSLIEHGTETTERDISWLDGLIEAERGRIASTVPGPSSTSAGKNEPRNI